MKLWREKWEDQMKDQIPNYVTFSTWSPERWVCTLSIFRVTLQDLRRCKSTSPSAFGAHDKGKWLGSRSFYLQLKHNSAGNSFFFFCFKLDLSAAWLTRLLPLLSKVCSTLTALAVQTRDKCCHCVVCQGNGEALTNIGFQSWGKKMLVYQFRLLLYIILYLLPAADNDLLTFPVWLVEVKSK